jgi:hypothetical protein
MWKASLPQFPMFAMDLAFCNLLIETVLSVLMLITMDWPRDDDRCGVAILFTVTRDATAAARRHATELMVSGRSRQSVMFDNDTGADEPLQVRITCDIMDPYKSLTCGR